MSIIVDHIEYTYGVGTAYELKALDDVSFQIYDGDFIGLLGHTGSGKSTLVQHLNGLLKPTRGTIYYNGEDIFENDYDVKKLRSNVGLVFQYPEHQLFEVDVFSDVCFGPRNIGLSKSEVELRAYEALKLVGIKDDCFYQSPFDLSGGEKRRVAIAGVIAMKPSVLILDEPTAGLDPKGRDEILELINRLHDESNMSIVLVSHSMDDVAENTKRILIMDNGKLVIDSTPKETFARFDELTSMGLDVPQISKVMHLLRQRGFMVDESVITLKEAVNEILHVVR